MALQQVTTTRFTESPTDIGYYYLDQNIGTDMQYFMEHPIVDDAGNAYQGSLLLTDLHVTVVDIEDDCSQFIYGALGMTASVLTKGNNEMVQIPKGSQDGWKYIGFPAPNIDAYCRIESPGLLLRRGWNLNIYIPRLDIDATPTADVKLYFMFKKV